MSYVVLFQYGAFKWKLGMLWSIGCWWSKKKKEKKKGADQKVQSDAAKEDGLIYYWARSLSRFISPSFSKPKKLC